MAKELKFSKNTVSKYISKLKEKNLVYNSPIGRYNLYFSTKKSFIPSKVIISMYKAFFLALKTKLPNQEQLYKDIGNELQKSFEYRYSKGFFENNAKKEVGLRDLKDFRPHFEYFVEVFNSSNILQDTAQVVHLRYKNNYKTAVYRISNSIFLEDNEDYTFYFYMIAGIIENYLGKELNREVICEILEIKVSDNKEKSYVDLSINIK
jgi:hypothetical protein